LSKHAVFYALDALTGRELYASGTQIKSWNHFSGLSVANGRVYIGTFDGMLYCFGLGAGAPSSAAAASPAQASASCEAERRPESSPATSQLPADSMARRCLDGKGTPPTGVSKTAPSGEIVPSTVIKSNTFIIYRGDAPVTSSSSSTTAY
jgi:hypothetical protein